MTVDDLRTDPSNPSCISNPTGLFIHILLCCVIVMIDNEVNGTSWRYGGVGVSYKSSITILAGSLLFNRTYQFMVQMENLRNASRRATGYLLVRVDHIDPQLIIVA